MALGLSPGGVSYGLFFDREDHSGGAGWGTQQMSAGSLEDTNWVCGRHTGKLAELHLRRLPSGVPMTLPGGELERFPPRNKPPRTSVLPANTVSLLPSTGEALH